MKNNILCLLIIVSIFSCKEHKTDAIHGQPISPSQKSFENNFLKFSYPEDWIITDDEEMDEGIHYISIEKKGYNSSGIITITSYEGLISLDDLITINIEQLEQNLGFANFKQNAIVESKFNTNQSRSSNFEFVTLGLSFEGTVYAFQGINNSYVLLKEGALEDVKKNSNGFKMIEESLEIK